ncbi:tRNA (adenosine(37)-N6)-threonylcarbamoyltransferase complex dimerization subunit type 1 TsaB [Glaciecola sp. SC05]|uniref:tRNA (adenosine(37)-N6)-threonylcarbamoyltransferase complex dimerization subunit type 1 TsaB n=1 Tax=Glaciecola sp. SC05 TaxID=1987355 RepID=UPI0035272C73
MKILCIDTATEACSAALLLDDTRDGIFEICPQQQSQRILPMIDELLTRNNIKLSQLDAIAYGRGPGSFTGVRIASSTIQGLALGSDLPVLEISTLAAMAQENFERFGVKQTLALIDARMSEVYCGDYQINENGVACSVADESVLPPADVKAILAKHRSEESYVGTGFHAYSQELGIQLQSDALAVNYPNAEFMLSLALSQYKSHQRVSVENVQPVYLRDKVTWKKLPNRE